MVKYKAAPVFSDAAQGEVELPKGKRALSARRLRMFAGTAVRAGALP
jgi:hypothetical protein